MRDRKNGTTRRVSVASRGRVANGRSFDPAISGDGGFVSFPSDAANLARGDRNRASDVFVHELRSGRTRRVSLGIKGRQANGRSLQSHRYRRGALVAFTSYASNQVRRDTNNSPDIFVRGPPPDRGPLAPARNPAP